MHRYLSSVGFDSIGTKKELDSLIGWVLEKPDNVTIVHMYGDIDLAQATREVCGHAGISVVGMLNEQGTIVPQYYFPVLDSTHISSEALITCEPQADREGFIGMCEDFRVSTSMIFSVTNVAEIMRRYGGNPENMNFRRVRFSVLASEGIVLLGQEIPEKVLQKARKDQENRRNLLMEAHEGDPNAMEMVARHDIREYHNVMRRLNETDLYTVVRTFFMPYGIENQHYYMLGEIRACQEVTNEYTGEAFYRMLVDINDIEMMLAIGKTSLMGIPEPGQRIRCHGWLMGEIG